MGDVEALYSIFAEDPHVLERMDGVAFADTPLLVAAGCRCWEHPFCDGNGNLKALAGLEAKSSLAQPHGRGFVGGIAIGGEFIRVKAMGMHYGYSFTIYIM